MQEAQFAIDERVNPSRKPDHETSLRVVERSTASVPPSDVRGVDDFVVVIDHRELGVQLCGLIFEQLHLAPQ